MSLGDMGLFVFVPVRVRIDSFCTCNSNVPIAVEPPVDKVRSIYRTVHGGNEIWQITVRNGKKFKALGGFVKQNSVIRVENPECTIVGTANVSNALHEK